MLRLYTHSGYSYMSIRFSRCIRVHDFAYFQTMFVVCGYYGLWLDKLHINILIVTEYLLYAIPIFSTDVCTRRTCLDLSKGCRIICVST